METDLASGWCDASQLLHSATYGLHVLSRLCGRNSMQEDPMQSEVQQELVGIPFHGAALGTNWRKECQLPGLRLELCTL